MPADKTPTGETSCDAKPSHETPSGAKPSHEAPSGAKPSRTKPSHTPRGLDVTDLPPRKGPRPRTTGAEIPHDQLEDFSPSAIREELVARARLLPGVVTGRSLVSEPGSLALRLPGIPDRNRLFTAFLHPSVDEFGHIHRSGFLHLTVEPGVLQTLVDLGWVEQHPITRRPEFPDTIVMFYAPRDEGELEVATAVLRSSHAQALVSDK
ncbi:luciferase family protein [Streptomyces sp. NPDC053792]|uniref:luciferase domain-containing protein n=1 Tax=Streptomyces sp. NPDC053792 TaxID=3365716 RepID=UPI0037D43DF4